MLRKLKRWNRNRKFIKAYRILRDEARHHTNAGHLMEFTAVNQGLIIMRCTGCPDIRFETKGK